MYDLNAFRERIAALYHHTKHPTKPNRSGAAWGYNKRRLRAGAFELRGVA